MNHKLSIYCPYCHRYTSVRQATRKLNTEDFTYTIALVTEDFTSDWWIGICNHCSAPVLVQDNGSTVYPAPLPEPTDERIPEDIRLDFDEAKMCFSVNCYRATCVLCRRAIQAACVLKGGKGNDLFMQIKDLLSKNIINKDLSDFAHTIRCLGRDSAHPDFGPVEKDDAEDSITLTKQFLEILFVTPTIAAERRAKREKK